MNKMEILNIFLRITILIILPVIFYNLLKFSSLKADNYLKKTKSGRIIKLILIPIALLIYLYFLFMVIVTIYSSRNL